MGKLRGWLFRWITLRRVVQLGTFILFLWLLLNTTYIFEGEEPKIPRDLFLRFDPLAGFITAISSRSPSLIFQKFVPALALLAAAFLVGRFFCNWICPLGTTLDLVDRIIRPKTRKLKGEPIKHTPSLRNLKYYLLVLFAAAAFFSAQLSWLMDPISIATRSYGVLIYPYLAKFVDLTLGPLYSVPVLNRITEPIYGLLTSKLMPEGPVVFRLQLLFLAIFAAILLLVKFHPRFWCRYLCPLGALLGAASRTSLLRRVVSDRCIDCGRCQAECRMNAIAENPRGYFSQECTMCLTCVEVCPRGAVSFRPTNPFGRVKGFVGERFRMSRRAFLKAALVGVAAMPILKLKPQEKDYPPFLIRPPGALPEEEFLDRCIRCGECMRACPTNALQPAMLEGGIEAIGTPIIVPKIGYCEYECNTCGKVCPTGAIRNLPLEEKQKFKIGTAFFNKNKCIPWNEHINCLVCEEHCPVPEKAIKFWEEEVSEQRTNRKVKVLLPYVVTDLCIGCGICENKCPLVEEPGIRVTARGEVRHKERYPPVGQTGSEVSGR